MAHCNDIPIEMLGLQQYYEIIFWPQVHNNQNYF